MTRVKLRFKVSDHPTLGFSADCADYPIHAAGDTWSELLCSIRDEAADYFVSDEFWRDSHVDPTLIELQIGPPARVVAFAAAWKLDILRLEESKIAFVRLRTGAILNE